MLENVQSFNRSRDEPRCTVSPVWREIKVFVPTIECCNSGKKVLHERYLARNSGNGSRLVRFALNEAVRERKLFPKASLILNASINRAINHFESHQHPTRHVKTRSTSHSIEAILSLVFELNGRCLLSSSRFNTFKRSRQSNGNI